MDAGPKAERYGLDAPGWVVIFCAGAAAALGASFALPSVATYLRANAVSWAVLAAYFPLCSLVLKRLWLRPKVLKAAGIAGGARVLDLGTGRGLLAIGAAQHAPGVRAVGIDLWSQWDLAGNSLAAAQANARAAKVAERVAFQDGDMQRLSFPDASFDAVVSSSAIHNISSSAGKEAALAEALRVLRPGGRLAICDLAGWKYAPMLVRLGATSVRIDWSLLPMWGLSVLLSAEKPRSS